MVTENDSEVKRESQVLSTNAEAESTLGQFFGRFSQRHRLKKFVAWILRYQTNLRRAVEHRKKGPLSLNKTAKIEPITVEEINKAEREILTHVQKEGFKEEIATLKVASITVERTSTAKPKKSQVYSSSRIFKLDPQLMDGLLRVGGLLEKAPVQLDTKHPMILPASHHVVRLIYHHISGHSDTEHVLSMIRERFWIIKGRAAVKRALSGCFSCRKRHTPVGEQKMANPPQDSRRSLQTSLHFPMLVLTVLGPFWFNAGGAKPRYMTLFSLI